MPRISGIAVLCLYALAGAGCGAERRFDADIVLTNARVFTADKRNAWAEAVAIKDGRFIYVGANGGANRYVGDATRSVDLGGRLVMPGLIDGHTHPGYIGVEQFGERLPAGSHEDLMRAASARAERDAGDGWLRLCCWSPGEYVRGRSGPHKAKLDAAVADRPVWINSRSWHSYWLNSRALEVLGIGDDTPDPRPGVAVYDRDANGQLTGWVKEGAGWQHFKTLFPADPEAHQQGIRDFIRTLSEHGVTTVYDGGNFGYEDEVYGFLAGLEEAGELPLRYEGTYQVFVPSRRHEAIAEMRRLRDAYGGERLRFRTIKLFMDGINANRSGAMLEPYDDIPDFVGETLLSTDDLRDFLLELHGEKLDLHVHVVGDLAVRRVLDAVEAAQAAVGEDFYPRITLAHLHLVSEPDLPRFAEQGVSANFTPWWHRMGRRDGPDPVLGAERAARLFGTVALFDAGANVTFSSDDWRLNVLSPFFGMQVGHVRRAPAALRADGEPAAPDEMQIGPDNPSLEQMLTGYTINGAYPFRMEEHIGSIETGKIADLLVLDENLFELDKAEIQHQKPSAVIMEGQLLHGEL